MSPGTPDTFRARTLDLHLLLDDLLHIAEVAEGDSRWTQYFSDLSAEIDESLLAEQRMIGPMSQLHTAISAVVDAAKHNRDPLAIKRKILVAKSLFGDPSRRLGEDLVSLIDVGPGQPVRKKAILFRLSTIASHVEYRGLGEESLNSIEASKVFSPPRELVDQILSPLNASRREYLCAMSVDGSPTDIHAVTLGTEFKHALREKTLPTDGVTTDWLALNAGCFVASAPAVSRSARAAAESQLQRLSEVLNVHNLYTNSAAYRVRPEVLVIEKGRLPYVVQVKPSGHFGLHPRVNARLLTRQRLKDVAARLSGRLANALESHALALAAGDPRTAIINLWTALEAISGSGSGGQPIGRQVASMIAPLVAWRRMDKVVTYLGLGLHSVLLAKKRHVSRRVMPRSSYFHICQDDVLAGIAGTSNNAAIQYMLKQCDECPLLRQRLYLAWKSFSDPDVVLSELQASKRRVEWQIQRLYRARNLLVHRGEHSHLIWRLLQNAQYYVSISLSRVLHDLSSSADWDIDTSLQFQAMRFQHVCTDLKVRGGRGLTHGDLLGTRSQAPTTPLWEGLTLEGA